MAPVKKKKIMMMITNAEICTLYLLFVVGSNQFESHEGSRYPECGLV